MLCVCLSGGWGQKEVAGVSPGSFTTLLLTSYCCMERACGLSCLHVKCKKVISVSWLFSFFLIIYIFMCVFLSDFLCTMCVKELVEARRGHRVSSTKLTGGCGPPCGVKAIKGRGVTGTDITDGCGSPCVLRKQNRVFSTKNSYWAIFPAHFLLSLPVLFWHMKVSCCWLMVNRSMFFVFLMACVC